MSLLVELDVAPLRRLESATVSQRAALDAPRGILNKVFLTMTHDYNTIQEAFCLVLAGPVI